MKKLLTYLLLLLTINVSAQVMTGVMAASGNSSLAGQISYWAFDETSGNAIDAMGLTNLTNYATQNQVGYKGTAYTFNGTDQYVGSVDATYEFTTPFSISAWVKTTSSGFYKFIISDFGGDYGYCLGMTDAGKLDFEIAKADYNRVAVSSASINTGNWVHVVGVWDGVNVICYVNSSKTIGNAETAVVWSGGAGERFEIGRREDGYYWNGGIDEVRIFNKALSDVEVTTIMGI
jgi:hypothetical protein